jgi:enamine deaminase RidA (YjgF/YER057c/UK114 family)
MEFGHGRGNRVATRKGVVEEKAVPAVGSGRRPIPKKAMHAQEALSEAYSYPRPSSFSRGIRLDIRGITLLFISGTASVGAQGESLHAGDLRAQTWRTFHNITSLLASEGATWKDVVRTTCYLKDMKDYADFNEIRTQFYREQGLDPLPASTGVQATLCRPELLVEIEAIAVFETEGHKRS